jgi:diguanylate cyclase (GGDEF)-like protein/PAS domain S-box-containing protein
VQFPTFNPQWSDAHSFVQNDFLDEAFLACTEGHSLFDSDGRLLLWSDSLADLYPPLAHQLKAGMHYSSYLRCMVTLSAIRNIGHIANLDEWVAAEMKKVGVSETEFVHHLLDGRSILVRHKPLSNGFWFFAAFDITELQRAKSAAAGSEQKFRNFARLSSDWFWELDENLCYLYHSSHNQPLSGIDVDKVVGTSRIIDVSGAVVDNEQLREHNQGLREHRYIDVVLTWTNPDGGSPIHSHIVARPLFDGNGKFTGYLGCGRDVSTLYNLKQQLEYHATHDYLTGLLNRRAFGEYLNEQLTDLQHHPAADSKTLICLDLDQFKLVNDSAGHQAGDQLLREVTATLRKEFGPDAVIARLGGDEFAIVVSLPADQAIAMCSAAITTIGRSPFHWQNRRFSIGASAGLTTIDAESTTPHELLSRADIACYSAKAAGRNQCQAYSSHSSFQRQQNEELARLKTLVYAMDNDGVTLYLQPIVPCKPKDNHDQPAKFEVLVRIRDVNGELISPAEVIPVAEKYDRMHQLDLRVIEQSIEAWRRLTASGMRVALSVNLSGNTLSNETCLTQIAALIEEHQLPPGSICFEVTETAAIESIERVTRFILDLRQRGCEFSLDDFGSGLSSFGYLKSLPVDYLKIDGSFVRNILDDKASRAIVTSFNTLSHEMGMKTVAEYVENDAIAHLLGELEIDYLQGYGVGVPRDLEAWIAELTPPLARTGS